MGHENFWIAIGLTAFAGMATGIGSAIAFFAKRANYRFLSLAMGFSAGVMIYVSFVEILSKANIAFMDTHGKVCSAWLTAGSFFGGMVFIGAIDRLVPKAENPHEPRTAAQVDALHAHGGQVVDAAGPAGDADPHHHRKLLRMGMFTALAIGIHNFPEGLATFLAALNDPKLGVALAVAIALHNIPEGISVSVPIFYATGSRRKAFVYSLASGFAEPVGALVGYVVLRSFLCQDMIGVMFGAVAGIMVFISLDELLPTSRAYGKGHDSLYGLMAGMVVMALSLLMFM